MTTPTDLPTVTAIAGLVTDLERARKRYAVSGDLIWQRTLDWVKRLMPTKGERGGGTAEPTDRDIEDRVGDRAASKYHDEVLTTIARVRADLARLLRIADLVDPPAAITLKSGQLQIAQVAAEGWCVSCWRNDKTCNPIALRPNKQPYYKDRCRPCGEWKHEHGQDPPMSILAMRHAGRRVTTADVAMATAR